MRQRIIVEAQASLRSYAGQSSLFSGLPGVACEAGEDWWAVTVSNRRPSRCKKYFIGFGLLRVVSSACQPIASQP